jgi:hypothetical protein
MANWPTSTFIGTKPQYWHNSGCSIRRSSPSRASKAAKKCSTLPLTTIAFVGVDHYRIPLPVVLSDSTHRDIAEFELVTVRVRDAAGIGGVRLHLHRRQRRCCRRGINQGRICPAFCLVPSRTGLRRCGSVCGGPCTMAAAAGLRAWLDVWGTFSGEATRLPIQIAALQPFWIRSATTSQPRCLAAAPLCRRGYQCQRHRSRASNTSRWAERSWVSVGKFAFRRAAGKK